MDNFQSFYGVQSEENTEKDRYLVFLVDRQLFGIAIEGVTEIIGMQKITPVPEVPDYINGIFNLRGQIVPVMDVRKRFKKPTIAYDNRTCIIVVDYRNIQVGLIVDGVKEVQPIPKENVVPPPKLASSSESRYVSGIGKVGDEVILIMNCDMLLKEDDAAEIVALGQ